MKKKEKLNGVQEPIRKLNDEKKEIQKNLNEKTIKGCLSTLKGTTTPQITYIMEEFAGILRNEGQKGTIDDAKLYL